MISYILAIAIFGIVFTGTLWLAEKHGSKAAQLDALKAELRKIAEEEARAKRINNFANGLNSDDARRLLQDVANKQRMR